MYNNTHAYTRPTKACNVWWRTEEGGGGGVGVGDGVGVIVGVGVGTVVASSSEAAVARRRWCGWHLPLISKDLLLQFLPQGKFSHMGSLIYRTKDLTFADFNPPYGNVQYSGIQLVVLRHYY